MECLLEASKDSCQCCRKHFDFICGTRVPVTQQTQEIFYDFFNEELKYGYMCANCDRHLKTFRRFKEEVLTNRELTEQNILWQEKIIENTDEESHEHLHEDPLTNSICDFYEEESELKQRPCENNENSNLKRILQSNLNKIRTTPEHKVILKSYKPRYVNGEEGVPPTKSPKVLCPLCDKPITYRALLTHLKTHDSNRERNFMCEICPKTFLNSHELVIHRRNHLNIRPFKCDFDDKRFITKNNLLKHILSQHLKKKRAVDFKVVCPVCQKLFPFPSKMLEHYKKAHPNGQDDGVKVNPATNHFHCAKCGQEFLTKYRIDNHVCMIGARGRTTENRCPVCLLLFQSRLELTKHLQEHGEKLNEKNKWRCKVCQTIVQDKIAVHVENTHSNESVTCNICNKQLKNRKSLRQHMFLSHRNGYEIRKKKRMVQRF